MVMEGPAGMYSQGQLSNVHLIDSLEHSHIPIFLALQTTFTAISRGNYDVFMLLMSSFSLPLNSPSSRLLLPVNQIKTLKLKCFSIYLTEPSLLFFLCSITLESHPQFLLVLCQYRSQKSYHFFNVKVIFSGIRTCTSLAGFYQV